MKKEIIAYKNNDLFSANIEQVSVKRNWMEESSDRHAYQCFPITLANTMGWAISFPEDISFIWDGICDTTPSHITILEGHRYCSTGRGNATISFHTYLTLKTDENITTLIMPVPNQFNESAQCYTTLISTSFYKSMLPVAWRIIQPNTKITIPAGTPVAVIIPISLTELQDFEVVIKNDHKIIEEYNVEIQENLKYWEEQQQLGKFNHLYRNAVNSKQESVGRHETKSIRLRTTKN